MLLLIAIALALSGAAPAARQYAWLRGVDSRGQPFDLASMRGQIVVLTFASKNTRDEATDVNEQLAKHAAPGTVSVVSVVDLENVPDYGHDIARKKIAAADQPGLHHLVDDQGALRRSFRVDPRRQVDIFVIGRDGAVLGHFVGESGVEQALKLIETLK